MKIIRTPRSIWRSLKWRYLRRFASPQKYADYLYYLQFGRHINWEHPEDLNQWINWLSFNTDTTEWSRLADKYAVREYVKECGLQNILVPLYAVWKKPEEINFDSLPDSFVLKANNGSGDVRIIKDKTQVDIEEIRKYFADLFAHPFGKDTAEPHYLRIPPRIIAEALLDKDKQSVPSSSLIDYKVWCINGKPKYILTFSDRHRDRVRLDCYDTKWNHRDDLVNFNSVHRHQNKLIPRPTCLDRMLIAATNLASKFPQVRVDFYIVDDKLYFGEMTFTGAAGKMTSFTPDALRELGNETKINHSND